MSAVRTRRLNPDWTDESLELTLAPRRLASLRGASPRSAAPAALRGASLRRA